MTTLHSSHEGGDGSGFLSFQQRVEQGHPEAVKTVAAILLAEIQRNLSKPGTGRYYGLHRQKNENASAKAEKNRRSYNRGLRKTTAALNDGSLSLDAVKKRYVRGLHRASAPGESPAPDTGALKRSAFMEQIVGGFLVGVAMQYARALEFGTPRIKPRPFMRPALAAVEKRIGFTLTKTAQDFAQSQGKVG